MRDHRDELVFTAACLFRLTSGKALVVEQPVAFEHGRIDSPFVIGAIGPRYAHRYMISGEEFDAAEAYRIGLLHDICEEPDLNERVGRMLAQIYSSGPHAIAAIKRLIPEVAPLPIDDALMEKVSQRIAAVPVTAEAQEGLSAFLEKRKPEFKGK